MIATQDRELQDYLRKKPGQPIIYLHKKTPVLEQPSELSRKTVEFKLNESFKFGAADEKKLGELISQEEKRTTLNSVIVWSELQQMNFYFYSNIEEKRRFAGPRRYKTRENEKKEEEAAESVIMQKEKEETGSERN